MAEETKLYTYYFSDPQGTTKNQRFHILYTEVPFEELPWHFHLNKPSEDLKSPVWSTDQNDWVEDSKDGQAAQMAQVSEMVDQLQKDHEQSVKQNEQAAQVLQQVQAQQMSSSKMMGQFGASVVQMQAMLKEINGKLDGKTEPQPADDKKEGAE